MWLYYLLKTISTLVSWLPYKLVVNIGIGIGHLYHKIAKNRGSVRKQPSRNGLAILMRKLNARSSLYL